MRHTDAQISHYYGEVIPASTNQEVNKLVDQMKTKIESAQNRPSAQFGRNVLRAEALDQKRGQTPIPGLVKQSWEITF